MGTSVKFKFFSTSVILATLMCAITPCTAAAQIGPPSLQTIASSGITAEAVGVAYNATQSQVSVQILLKNTSNVRIYLQDAQTDSTQNAILGSGQGLISPNVDGLPSCNNNYSECSGSENSTAIANFSYIDPGSVLAVALRYNASQPPSNPDTVSFSLTMLARFAKSDVDNSPDDAEEVREITLPFADISFTTNK
jgi:hypothetical protein